MHISGIENKYVLEFPKLTIPQLYSHGPGILRQDSSVVYRTVSCWIYHHISLLLHFIPTEYRLNRAGSLTAPLRIKANAFVYPFFASSAYCNFYWTGRMPYDPASPCKSGISMQLDVTGRNRLQSKAAEPLN